METEHAGKETNEQNIDNCSCLLQRRYTDAVVSGYEGENTGSARRL